jgi:hypothetical protein
MEDYNEHHIELRELCQILWSFLSPSSILCFAMLSLGLCSTFLPCSLPARLFQWWTTEGDYKVGKGSRDLLLPVASIARTFQFFLHHRKGIIAPVGDPHFTSTTSLLLTF